jgi:hypothetical protein
MGWQGASPQDALQRLAFLSLYSGSMCVELRYAPQFGLDGGHSGIGPIS